MEINFKPESVERKTRRRRKASEKKKLWKLLRKWSSSMWKVKVKLIEGKKRSSLEFFVLFLCRLSFHLARHQPFSSVSSALASASTTTASFHLPESLRTHNIRKLFNYAHLHNERLQHNIHSRLFTMVSMPSSGSEALNSRCMHHNSFRVGCFFFFVHFRRGRDPISRSSPRSTTAVI